MLLAQLVLHVKRVVLAAQLGYVTPMDSAKKDQRIPIMMSAAEVQAIDAWRRQQDDLPSRAEAIRRLVDVGLSKDRA